MKIFLALFISFTFLFAELELSGHLDVDSQAYLIRADAKHKNSFTLKQTLEFKYEKDDLTAFAKLYAQEDYYDFLSEDEHNERTFARLDELFLKVDYEDDSIQAGKNIKFWGALELRNIVDGFNPKEFRDDMFSKTNKCGVWNASYSHYTESAEITLIVKLNEPDQKMASYPYVYYFFPEFVTYEDKLESSHGVDRPSLYLLYSGTTETEYALDFAFIYEYGYDSQRYFTPDNPLNLALGLPTEFRQNAYIASKFMIYNTLVVDSTLIKLEALYAKVDVDAAVGDYSHVAVGFEHTVENFYKSAGLGLIGEYYNYRTYDGEKYSDLELFETMQNDLFLGLRYSFNDSDDASIVGGVVADFEYDEEVYYFKYDSRLGDSFRVGFDYYYIEPSKDEKTAYALLGRHQRVALNLAYYF